MSDKMNITLPESEQAKFKAWTNQLAQDNKIKCKVIIQNAVLKIDRNAKMFAPVNLSFLKSSIHPRFNSDGMGGEVYTGRKYAPYVEFGTGTKVVAPADVAAYAMTFKGKGLRKHNQRAQPYLFPAWRLAQKEMIKKLNDMGFK
jgi:hypothetical protein